MKISIVCFLCTFTSFVHTQIQTVEYEYNGIIVSMSSIDSIYNLQDTVVVNIKLLNSTKDTFFISSHTNKEQFVISGQGGSIDYEFGGGFDPEFGLTFKLDVFTPGDSIEFILKLIWKDSLIEKLVEAYCLNMWFGMFNYSGTLLYLTEATGGFELTQIEEDDILAMYENYKYFVVGCLPIKVRMVKK